MFFAFFKVLRQGLAKLLRLDLNLKYSCFPLPEGWDYRHVPPSLALRAFLRPYSSSDIKGKHCNFMEVKVPRRTLRYLGLDIGDSGECKTFRGPQNLVSISLWEMRKMHD